MPSPDVLDFEKLLAPVAGENPAGGDLRAGSGVASLYYAVKDGRNAARAAERRIEGGQDETPPDWKPVVASATKALTESKDLELTAYLIEALCRVHGFAGLGDGFKLARGLAEAFWDGIHPRPDEDGLATTLGPLSGLNGDDAEGTLIAPINRVGITDSASHGRLNTFLEQILRRTVAATTVAHDQQSLRVRVRRPTALLPPPSDAVAAQLPRVVRRVQVDRRPIGGHVEHAVRDHLVRPDLREIVVERLDRLCREGRARPVEVAQQFLLLGIDADHRIARRLILSPVFRDGLELGVAVGVMSHRLLLAGGASADLELAEQTTNRPPTGRGAHPRQPSGQLPERQVGPQNAFPHRVAGGELAEQFTQVVFEEEERVGQGSASTPFFRTRSAAGSWSASRSRKPWRMVFGSQPSRAAMYSTPPCPSLAASTAA
ncbi:MAG: hypothetical protein FJ304_19695 [Planctomycetes bacterium]|nr:hypothetical protein [Planctomycetota bacterium]